MPLDEKIRDYLESSMRVGLYSLRGPISPNFSLSAQVPIHLGHSVLFRPIPTLGESALTSATRLYRQREPESPQAWAGRAGQKP